MPCKTCQHPQHQAIDLALLKGNPTLWDLSEQYGLSTSSLFRHKKHLDFQLARTRENFQHRRRQDILFQYNEFLQETREHARTAKAEGNTRLALQATSAGARILNSITKLDVQLDDDTTYRLLASPDWVSQDSLFPTDPQFRAACHQSLASEFFSPCPDLPPDAPATTRREASESDPKSQREISAKLPRKSRSEKENRLQIQLDNQCKKTFAKKVQVGPENDAPPAVPQPCLPPNSECSPFPFPSSPTPAFSGPLSPVPRPSFPGPPSPVPGPSFPGPPSPVSGPSSLIPGASLPAGSQPFNNIPSSQIEICCFPFAASPRNKREMSAKLPRNSRSEKDNSKQLQSDNLLENTFAKNVQVGPETAPGPAGPPVPRPRSPVRLSPVPGPSSPRPPSPVPGPSPLTPEMRRQLFTPLFPKGDGAMDPEKIEAPEKMPPLPHPQKRNKFKKLLHFFRKKSELPPEAAQCQSPAPSALDQDATRPAATPIPFPLKSCEGTPFFTKILDFHCNRGSIS